MHPVYYKEYLKSSSYEKLKILGVMNPEKVKALAFLIDLHKRRGYMVFVISSLIVIRSWYSVIRSILLNNSKIFSRRKF